MEKPEIITSHNVAVLEKQGKFAAIGLAILPHGTELAKFDGEHQCSPQYSPMTGIVNFKNSIEHSLKNGWSLVSFGKPNDAHNS